MVKTKGKKNPGVISNKESLIIGLCVQCVGNECPEVFSGALMSKSKCFENGWHVHKNGNGYAVFKDDWKFE